MKLKFKSLLAPFLVLGLFVLMSLVVEPMYAAPPSCRMSPDVWIEQAEEVTLTINNLDISKVAEVQLFCGTLPDQLNPIHHSATAEDAGGGDIRVTFPNDSPINPFDEKCWRDGPRFKPAVQVLSTEKELIGTHKVLCQTDNIFVKELGIDHPCTFDIDPNPPNPDQDYSVTITNLDPAATNIQIKATSLGIRYGTVASNVQNGQPVSLEGKHENVKVRLIVTGDLKGATYDHKNPFCGTEFVVGKIPATNTRGGADLGTTPICTFAENLGATDEEKKATKKKCDDCLILGGVWTPFGCINATPQKFVAQLLEIAIGIGGGLAFLMIVYGGFVIMTSSGNPEKLNGGKEIVTSAIAGLLLIVFSVVILKIIGVDILKIPGF